MVRLTSKVTGDPTNRPLGDVLRERYAEITAMDRAIGKLRNYLKEEQIQKNTIVWYCGDNGTPPDAGHVGMTVRADKGSLYEGGVLVPGVLEWPALIDKPSSTKTISATSDFFPTIAEIVGVSLPDRSMDGTSLLNVINNPETEREKALCFWQINRGLFSGDSVQDYIDSMRQEGTTPLVKKLNGKYTRSFRNYVYTDISEGDFSGERTIMHKNLKLVVDGQSPNEKGFELYDIESDRAEQINIADSHPEKVKQLNDQLQKWQESVLNSLKGADY
jgi:arylsulfatase A-like enzyme